MRLNLIDWTRHYNNTEQTFWNVFTNNNNANEYGMCIGKSRWSFEICAGSLLCVCIYVLSLEIQLSRGSARIPLPGLNSSHFCARPLLGPECPTSYIVVVFVFSEFSYECILLDKEIKCFLLLWCLLDKELKCFFISMKFTW